MAIHLNIDGPLRNALSQAGKTPTSITTADPLFAGAWILAQSVTAPQFAPHVVITRDLAAAQKFTKYYSLFTRLNSPMPGEAFILPPHDISPYSGLYSSRSQMLQRLQWLHHASFAKPGQVFVAPIKGLAQKTLPADLLLQRSYEYKKGDELPSQLPSFLAKLGYQSVPIVEDPGTFSMRGGIVDIYSPAQQKPVRLELFGDMIESLRTFEPTTQRSLEEINSFAVIPGHEILFTDDAILRCCKTLEGKKSESDISFIQSQVRTETYFDGVEFLLPCFYEKLSLPTDFFSAEPTYWWLDSVADENYLASELSVLSEEYAQVETHLPSPKELYFDMDQLQTTLRGRRVDVDSLEITEGNTISGR